MLSLLLKPFAVQDPDNWTTCHPDRGCKPPPLESSQECKEALKDFFANDVQLGIAAEASSHPTGLLTLFGQPYVYAGGGLGNMDECPLQICLAGGPSHDALTFAAVCAPHECKASDLSALDYLQTLHTLGEGHANLKQLALEYAILHERIYNVNQFLKTGWTCGEYQVPFRPFPFGALYVLVSAFLVGMAVLATCRHHRKSQKQQKEDANKKEENNGARLTLDNTTVDATNEQPTPSLWSRLCTSPTLTKAFDVHANVAFLVRRRAHQTFDTSCLDGLRVFSIFWVVLGHAMAIQSSSGGGYNNPKEFLPPNGITSLWYGQLLFAARFAVDSFLVISGHLVVVALGKQKPRQSNMSFSWRYLKTMPLLLLYRLFRILPLYAMALGLWTQVAPQLGSGPFWYQWESFLVSCRQYGWANWFFVNNFFPLNLANTETCFYHSWYLALDMQLSLVAPLLVYWHQWSNRGGKWATGALLALSIGVTLYLSWTRQWSINTFDGAAVARFDIEGYAKPHVRAQAYLAGMLLGMILKEEQEEMQKLQVAKEKQDDDHEQQHSLNNSTMKKTLLLPLLLLLAIAVTLVITFITVTGAYTRRACHYDEWPHLNECGSKWTPNATFWYTGLSRALWSWAICTIIYVCIHGRGGVVNYLLSLPCWTPLSHLSFGVYLLHPIVIFVWRFGDRQKQTFRLFTFAMSFLSISVVSFGLALFFMLVVELPLANLARQWMGRLQKKLQRKEEEEVKKEQWDSNEHRGLLTSSAGSGDDPLSNGHNKIVNDGVKYGSLS